LKVAPHETLAGCDFNLPSQIRNVARLWRSTWSDELSCSSFITAVLLKVFLAVVLTAGLVLPSYVRAEATPHHHIDDMSVGQRSLAVWPAIIIPTMAADLRPPPSTTSLASHARCAACPAAGRSFRR
jgi:hypothetical protein